MKAANFIYSTGIIPNLSDILDLYNDAGWYSYTANPETLIKGITNSMAVYTVWFEKELIGLARIIGDGFTIICIQDIIIKVKYRRMEIGSNLINMILSDYQQVRQIALITDDRNDTHGFYTSLGFKPVDTIACRAYLKIKGE